MENAGGIQPFRRGDQGVGLGRSVGLAPAIGNVMKQSTTYQSILKEGRQEGRQEGESLGRVHEAQRILLLQGTKRFGEPSKATAAALEEIQDVERLETLGVRILEPDVMNWNDLLSGS
jgi:hypothetical protein